MKTDQKTQQKNSGPKSSEVPDWNLHRSWFASPIPVYRAWCHFLWLVRLSFHQKDYLETPTPTLVTCPGSEPSIDFFEVDEKFLPSSPELSLKKVLALGIPKVFEIKTCFRKDFPSRQHLSEFQMLEWYNPGSDVGVLVNGFQALLADLCDGMKLLVPSVQQKRVDELFFENLGQAPTPTWSKDDYQNLLSKHQIHFSSNDSIDDLFFRIWIEKIEPTFDPEKVLFVTHYPPFQAAYSKLNQQGWAERVEVYWRGLELANGFCEVEDAVEQEERIKVDNHKRLLAGRKQVPLDEPFLDAIRSGFAPTVGIAVGLERLFMALFKIEDIQQVHKFQ